MRIGESKSSYMSGVGVKSELARMYCLFLLVPV